MVHGWERTCCTPTALSSSIAAESFCSTHQGLQQQLLLCHVAPVLQLAISAIPAYLQGTDVYMVAPGGSAAILEADLAVCGGRAVVHIINGALCALGMLGASAAACCGRRRRPDANAPDDCRREPGVERVFAFLALADTLRFTPGTAATGSAALVPGAGDHPMQLHCARWQQTVHLLARQLSPHA